MGVPAAEYERTVGPANRYFHELAELVLLHKQGVLPLDPDDDGGAGGDAAVSPAEDVATHGRK